MNATACPHTMFVTQFDTLFDIVRQSEQLSWSEFVSRYSQHAVLTDKKAASLISPAEWPAGSKERKGNEVVRVHFAALDLDGVPTEIVTQIRTLLQPYAYVMYTTWSHPDKFKKEGLRYSVPLIVSITKFALMNLKPQKGEDESIYQKSLWLH